MAVDQHPQAAASHARSVGLSYAYDQDPGITRRKRRSEFAYYDSRGKLIRDPREIARCRKLAVPPAWTNVWICPNADGHIQATGKDARGRKQYRYHQDWRVVRDREKFQNMARFGTVLPALRRTILQELNSDGLTRGKVIAAIVRLLDRTGLRVGNDHYFAENHTHGLTTISKKHVELHGREIELDFPGKGGKLWHGRILAPRVARVVAACADIPGYRLFKYYDDQGIAHAVGSGDVNGWLQATTDDGAITAKDFRTWHACVLFVEEAVKQAAVKDGGPATLKPILKAVAQQLGNTPAILQKSYVHPNLMDLYRAGAFATAEWREIPKKQIPSGLQKTEALLLRWMRRQYGTRKRSSAA
jgi:DNA topoisomerase I